MDAFNLQGQDRLAEWMIRRLQRRGSGPVIALVVAACVLLAGVVVASQADGSRYRAAFIDRYNDALVEGDVDLAWALGCRADRETVDRASFARSVDAALVDLGGELVRWERLRGGIEWFGPAGSIMLKPDIVEIDGDFCVGLGGNPLGEPVD